VRVYIINFFILLFVVFIFVALGQWNHPHFQQKAYDRAKELITVDLTEKGEKPESFIEPADLSTDPIHAEVVTEDGNGYLYDIAITNPVLIQFSALNLVVSPKVKIISFIKSRP